MKASGSRFPTIIRLSSTGELFDQVQAQRPRFKCPKKKAKAYPLRSKVFCGCCGHAMPRRATKTATFFCRYTLVNEAADCHGLTVTEAERGGDVSTKFSPNRHKSF